MGNDYTKNDNKNRYVLEYAFSNLPDVLAHEFMDGIYNWISNSIDDCSHVA